MSFNCQSAHRYRSNDNLQYTLLLSHVVDRLEALHSFSTSVTKGESEL